MFDQHMYSKILEAAYYILLNEGHKLGKPFCEGFMVDHDPQQGQGSIRNAQGFFDYVVQEVQRQNGSLTIRSDAQLGQIVTEYIKNIFNMWSQRQGGFGGGFNSGSSSRPMGNMFGGGSGGLSFGNQSKPLTSYRNSDVIEPMGSQPQVQQAQAPAPTIFPVTPTPQGVVMMANYPENPLDDITEQGAQFNQKPEGPGWGFEKPHGHAIVMTNRNLMQSSDNKYRIAICGGVDPVFHNDVMQVINNFVDTAPESFMAENFIFRVLYNHIEVLDVPTDTFRDISSKIRENFSSSRMPLYDALKEPLDTLPYGCHKVIVKYLLQYINQGLYSHWRYASNPSFVLKMTELEDIPYLLGTEANLAILKEPNAKEALLSIIKTSILNALLGSSQIMFGDHEDKTFDIVKHSDVFPDMMEGVYPNKASIPYKDEEGYDKFVERFIKVELTNKTYIRQIKTVVFTNVFGNKTLASVGKDPTPVSGQIASLFNAYIPAYISGKISEEKSLFDYDEDNKMSYDDYLSQVDEFDKLELRRFDNISAPSVPAEQTVVAFQFKTKPQDYMQTMNLCTVMGTERGGTTVLLSRKHVPVLTPIG